MPQQVCNGATLQCSFGLAPSSMVVPPINRVNTGEQPDANIMDSIPPDEHRAVWNVHVAGES
jgi:hypothetical protein